ncbi:MAG: hypothetical protein GXO07_00470 [Crenarchaeota archaeon]|nr:hypothetical protein [Thermoproteota archaeon]
MAELEHSSEAVVAVKDGVLFAVVPDYKGLIDEAERGVLELLSKLEELGCEVVSKELNHSGARFVLLCPGIHVKMAYIRCREEGCIKKVFLALPTASKSAER